MLRLSSVKQIGRRGPFDIFSAWPDGGPMERVVLLYRLRSSFRVDPRQVTAFLADMRSLAEAGPPGVWRILEAGTREGRLFVVGEYRHATALSSVLGRLVSQGLEVAAVVEILAQVARALLGAHTCPGASGAVIHGTLGPAQVLLDFDGNVWVRDFALYRLLGDGIGNYGGVLLAPEQKRGARPDQRSDVFSLGRLGQELLLLTSSGKIPEDLTRQLSVMAAPEPRERPANPAEFLEQWRQEASAGRAALARLGQLLADKMMQQPELAGKTAGQDKARERPAGDGDLLDPASFWQVADNAEPTDGVQLDSPGLSAGNSAPGAALDPENGTIVTGAQAGAKSVFSSVIADEPVVEQEFSPPVRPQSGQQRSPEASGARRPVLLHSPPAAEGRYGSRIWLVLVVVVLLALGLALSNWLSAGGPADEQARPMADGRPHLRKKRGLERAVEQIPETGGQESAAKKQRLEGVFSIVSTPPGAVVYINGRKQGVTPTVVRSLPLGQPIKVKLDSEGYRPWEGEFTATAREPKREIEAGLFPNEQCRAGTGWLYVSSEPSGATVELDGKRFPGATPLIINNLCAGKHYSVGLRLPGYLPWHREDVIVVPDQVNNVRAQLTR